MLLGFNSFSFTTTEARAQAGGGGGGNRAVTITATTNTPGITVSGPIEEGFDEGVSAFLVEFTPPNPGDEPPPQADIAIMTLPRSGWTLKEPMLANLPVTRQVPRGGTGQTVEWHATRVVSGVQEDEAEGNVLVIWPWAEFEVVEWEPLRIDPYLSREGQFFEMGGGILISAVVSISVQPHSLPGKLRDNEAARWRVDWVQNITSVGRTCYYPTKHVVIWWDTAIKQAMPLFDSLGEIDEPTVSYWYTNLVPAAIPEDHAEMWIVLADTPMQQWTWFAPSPWGPGSFEGNCADRALHRDAFTAWIVSARGEGDQAVYQWERRLNWSTDLRADLDYSPPNEGESPWRNISMDLTKDAIDWGDLQHGRGPLVPDVNPKNFNQLLDAVINEND